MKRRNQLLALLCLLVFGAFGVLYFRYWVVQKPFGIILFVGEGLSADRLAALRMYAANAETPLTIDSLAHTALLKNYSKDSAAPDRAAAATALATGVKVANGSIAVDGEGNALTNLLELARASGRTTGLVTDGSLTGATAAAFYAHTTAKTETPELARTLIESAKVDIVLGGGLTDFMPEQDGGARADGRDLLSEAADAYDVVRTRTELEAVPWWRWPRVFGVFARGELTHGDEIGPETLQPSLSDMVRRAIELLQIHRGGYLLVVDAALMRQAAEQNDAEATLAAMLELDRAISVALRFAGTKATVFVCGDAAIGGMKLSGFPPQSAGGSQMLVNDSLGAAHLTWATGPAVADSRAPSADGSPAESPPRSIGPRADEPPAIAPEELGATVDTTAPEPPSASGLPETPPTENTSPEPVATAVATAAPSTTPTAAPAAIYAPAALHTVEDVIAFGVGRGAEALHGTLENTAVFEIIRDNL